MPPAWAGLFGPRDRWATSDAFAAYTAAREEAVRLFRLASVAAAMSHWCGEHCEHVRCHWLALSDAKHAEADRLFAEGGV